jgi:hypothetical protein
VFLHHASGHSRTDWLKYAQENLSCPADIMMLLSRLWMQRVKKQKPNYSGMQNWKEHAPEGN